VVPDVYWICAGSSGLPRDWLSTKRAWAAVAVGGSKAWTCAASSGVSETCSQEPGPHMRPAWRPAAPGRTKIDTARLATPERIGWVTCEAIVRLSL
jgi:hypothetical protein